MPPALGANSPLPSIPASQEASKNETLKEDRDEAHIVVGAIFDQALEGKFSVSVVATALGHALESGGLTIAAATGPI
jgi:cell division GTPase FtsZ